MVRRVFILQCLLLGRFVEYSESAMASGEECLRQRDSQCKDSNAGMYLASVARTKGERKVEIDEIRISMGAQIV